MCAECGNIYSGLNSRNNAIHCYESHQEPDLPTYTHISYEIPEREPGDGIERPYPSGHYKRVKPGSPDYNRVQMEKARRKWEQDRDYIAGLMRTLEHWPETVTPMQRLAYAFKMKRWESVKQAAIALAYTVAIQKRLDDLDIPRIIRDELRLQSTLETYLNDEDQADHEQGQKDGDKLIDKLRLDSILDDILRGKSDDDDNEP